MKLGVLIVNLGTPDSPDVPDVRRYLKQFLMDRYVIDKPLWFRFLLVHGIIVPFRAKKSATLYQKIWTQEGSPLLVHSKQFSISLEESLPDSCTVVLGMRYGAPSIDHGLQELYQHDVEHILALPMYPQYAASSSQTAIDEVIKQHQQDIPLTFMDPFYQNPLYLETLSHSIAPYWQSGAHDHLLLSYHGLPQRHLTKLNPQCIDCLKSSSCQQKQMRTCYRSHVYQTSKDLQQSLGLHDAQLTTAFQSRLGSDPWVQPFTQETVQTLAAQGKKNLLVACPSFVADCLETLEEIGLGAKQSFLDAGGKTFTLAPCLNASQPWVDTVASWCSDYIKNIT